MRIALAGGSGLVGGALRRRWAAAGHEVVQLVRRKPRQGETAAEWNPEPRRIDLAALAGCEAVVNLAGEGIAAGRWTPERKRRIRESRVRATGLLASAMESGAWRPRVWINASATGYYGDTGERVADEAAPRGNGFLASVCDDWEAATLPAVSAGVRVVRLRLGVVLDPAGGALARMLPLFRAGLGGRIGTGRQWMSWIALDELCRVIDAALADERIVGPVNAVEPEPVRNAEFVAVLGRVLRRPAVVPVPTWVVELAMGELARETLLGSSRVEPACLRRLGFEFMPGGLEGALRRLLG